MTALRFPHIPVPELIRFAVAARPDAPEFDAVRVHLGGCPRCERELAVLRSAATAAPGAPGAHPNPLMNWIVPKRVAPPGAVRAGVLADHQLVCGVGDYELDVIVRELETSRRLDIGGQVTQARALHDPARDVPLYLVEARNDDVLSATRTDEFGEFDFSAAGGSRYGLRVGDGELAPCVLVWDGAQ